MNYNLSLFHYDPGDDPLTSWHVNWGDGNTATLAGDATLATHKFTSYGTYTITASAFEDNAEWPVYTQSPMTVTIQPGAPDAPTGLVVAPLSRSKIQLAWHMPDATEASGFTIHFSTDGVNFQPLATLPHPGDRAFTATGLDPQTPYTFTVSAYNDDGESDGSDTQSAATTNDEWQDMDTVTPALSTTGPDVAWFTPPDGQGDGPYFHYGTYQVLYAGGAYNLANVDDNPAFTSGYYYRTEDPTAYAVQDHLAGVAYRPSLEDAEHDTYATAPIGASFFAADEKIGAFYAGGEPDGDDPGPGATWTLQRRVPHAGVYALQDSTTEGDVETWIDTDGDGVPDTADTSALAKLYFYRDDRPTEPLTLHFTLTPASDALTADDYSAVAKIPDGNGGFTEAEVNLAGGAITLPPGTFANPINGIEVDITATDDTDPEWTEDFSVRLDDSEDGTYIADHPNDHDNYDADGDGFDEDPDAAVLLKDNDLSFDLQQGTLIANYNDSNNDGITDYDEDDSGSDPDLYEMKLHVPRIDKPGAKVVLDLPADFVNVYLAPDKGQLLVPDDPGGGGGRYTWDGNASQVPQSVWLEVKKGSQAVDDMTCSLSTDDNGDQQSRDQHNTAVNFEIDSLTDPNNDGGGDVKNKQRPWLVGQMVDQYVNVQCPPEWRQNPTYQWTVPGNVLRDYVIAQNTATTLPLVDDDGGQTDPVQLPRTGRKCSEVKFFWVSTDGAAGDPDIRTVSISVGNINGISYTITSKYEVYNPSVNNETVSFSSPRINPLFQWLSLDSATGPGMKWTADVRPPADFAEGDWNFLQLVTPGRFYSDSTRSWHVHGTAIQGLDTAFPYAFPTVAYNATVDGIAAYSSPLPAGTGMSDSPSLSLIHIRNLGGVQASVSESFETYIMYRPPGGDSRWVPVRRLLWGWSAVAQWNPNTQVWQLMPGGTPDSGIEPLPTPDSTSSEPIWNVVHSSASLSTWE